MNKWRRMGGFSVVLAMLIGLFVVGDVIVGGVTPSSTSHVAAAGEPVQPLVSARIADTRNEPTSDGQYTNIGRRPAKTPTPIKVAGRGGVPADASAVIINLTSVQPAAYTYLTVYPCGTAQPDASNLNSPPRIDRANSALVKLAADGTICVYNEAEGDFVVDVNGFVPAASTPTAVVPARLLDTRPGKTTVDGSFLGAGPAGPRSITRVQVTGRGGVPANATAAIFNLTAELPRAHTYLTAYPCDGSKPTDSSNLNVPPGDTRANNVFVKLDSAGAVCIYTEATTDIIIDINGYVPAGGNPTSINPIRLADSRKGEHTFDGQHLGFGQPGPHSETRIQITGRAGIPTNATAALINLTADKTSAGTYLTAYPCDTKRPEPASNLNLPQNDTAANSIYVKLNPQGQACIYTVAPTDIIIDINGYTTTPVTTAPAPTPPAPAPIFDCAASASSIPVLECQALVALYTTNGGANWVYSKNWTKVADPCDWDNVFCSDGHVTYLYLSNEGMTGAIPSEIGNLTSLVELNLRWNKITGLPPEIRNLTKLRSLEVGKNPLDSGLAEIGNLGQLTQLNVEKLPLGTLPSWLLNLKSLQFLNLDSTNLTSLAGVTALSNLTSLSARENGLTALPDLSVKLTYLDLKGNPLAKVPSQISGLKDLTYLDLSKTKLSGTLDASINNLANLTTLYLWENQLTALPSLSKLTKLTKLELGSNKFTVFPTQISALTTLKYLSLSDNQLTALPNNFNFGIYPQLSTLYLSNNLLSGSVTGLLNPVMKGNKLKYLSLSGNKCLTTTDAALAAWLTKLDPGWKSGCS